MCNDYLTGMHQKSTKIGVPDFFLMPDHFYFNYYEERKPFHALEWSGKIEKPKTHPSRTFLAYRLHILGKTLERRGLPNSVRV